MIFSKAAISTGRSSSSVLVYPAQAQLSGSDGNDGRARNLSSAYDDQKPGFSPTSASYISSELAKWLDC
jgi:hypothetical protein